MMTLNKAIYTHIGGRSKNEDYCLCESLGREGVCAIVTDGLGGHGQGEVASRIAAMHLSQCKSSVVLPTEPQILGWFQSADQEILKRSGSENGMKTTAVFLMILHGCAVWAHIGDSRLYHFHNGALADLTLDHSVPQMQVSAGLISRYDINKSVDRSRLLQSLGSGSAQPEIAPACHLEPGSHAFLLCTDGFWEYLTDDEIWLDLQKSQTPDDWLRYLRCRGEARKGEDADNNTAIAIFAEV